MDEGSKRLSRLKQILEQKVFEVDFLENTIFMYEICWADQFREGVDFPEFRVTGDVE